MSALWESNHVTSRRTFVTPKATLSKTTSGSALRFLSSLTSFEKTGHGSATLAAGSSPPRVKVSKLSSSPKIACHTPVSQGNLSTTGLTSCNAEPRRVLKSSSGSRTPPLQKSQKSIPNADSAQAGLQQLSQPLIHSTSLGLEQLNCEVEALYLRAQFGQPHEASVEAVFQAADAPVKARAKAMLPSKRSSNCSKMRSRIAPISQQPTWLLPALQQVGARPWEAASA